MTVFEKLTESPEVLGAFLQSLPCLEGPWDAEFQERFCSECGKATCDPACEFERFRNNPGWWLTLDVEKCAPPETHVIELDPAELEKPLTAEAVQFTDERLFSLAVESGTKTAILTPLKDGATSIILTPQTAEILVAMLNRQIREWSES